MRTLLTYVLIYFLISGKQIFKNYSRGTIVPMDAYIIVLEEGGTRYTVNLRYYLNKVNEENAIDEYIREQELYEDIEDDSLRNFYGAHPS